LFVGKERLSKDTEENYVRYLLEKISQDNIIF